MIETHASHVQRARRSQFARAGERGARPLPQRALWPLRLHRLARHLRVSSSSFAFRLRFRPRGDAGGAGTHRRGPGRRPHEYHAHSAPSRRRKTARLSALGRRKKTAPSFITPGNFISTTSAARSRTAFIRDGTCIRRNSRPRYAAVFSFFLENVGFGLRAAAQFHGESRAGHACGPGVRRRSHGAGTLEPTFSAPSIAARSRRPRPRRSPALSAAELRSGSFFQILQGRRG